MKAVAWQIRFCLNNFRDENRLHYLQAVAAARFVLCVAAECIGRVLNEPSAARSTIHSQLAELFAQTKELCETWTDSNLHFFLLKQLVKREGIDVLAKLRQVYGLEWLENLIPQQAEVNEKGFCCFISVSNFIAAPRRHSRLLRCYWTFVSRCARSGRSSCVDWPGDWSY